MTEIPKAAEFFHAAFPKKGGDHFLVVGEDHRYRENALFLKEHLQELIKDHHVGTLGMEFPPYMNVIFWAYTDHTLDRLYGSHTNAQDYVRELLQLNSEVPFAAASAAKAELAIAAMDSGIRVVAYDARDRWGEEWSAQNGCRIFLENVIEHYGKSQGLTALQVRRKMLSDPTLCNALLEQAAEADLQYEIDLHGKDTLLKLVREDGYRSLQEYKDQVVISDQGVNLGFAEIARLIKNNPHYQARLNAMEEIVNQAIKLDNPPIPSDALSALLLNAARVPGKNTITLSGFQHMDGIGFAEDDPIQTVHGTFHRHLEQIQDITTSPKITRAIVGTAAVAARISHDMFSQRRQNSSRFLQENEGPLVYAVDQQKLSQLPVPNPKHPNIVSFAHKIGGQHKRHLSGDTMKSRANPLLIPAIKQAYDDVRADWNPGYNEQVIRQ